MAQIKLLKIGSIGLPEEMSTTGDDITLSSFTVNGGPVLSTSLDMNGGNISDAGDLAFTDPTTDGITRTDGTHAADDLMLQDVENAMAAGAAILFPVISDTADQVDALRVPALAGVPSATPSDGGQGYIVWDSTNKDLYAWDGSAWDNLNVVTKAERLCNSYTAEASVTIADAVYISSADSVSPAQANADTTAQAMGFASATILATNPVEVCSDGVILGFTGLTAGSRYFLDASTAGAVTATAPSGGGNSVIQVGYAKSATEMQAQFQVIGKKV